MPLYKVYQRKRHERMNRLEEKESERLGRSPNATGWIMWELACSRHMSFPERPFHQ